MKENFLVAVSASSGTVILDEMRQNPNLLKHLGALNLRHPMDIKDQGGSGPCTNYYVGETCDGLTVIAVASSQGYALAYPSCGYSSFACTWAGYVGPWYTLNIDYDNYLACIKYRAASFKDDMLALAQGFVSGVLTSRITGNLNIPKIVSAAKLLIASSISAESFWVTLSSLLTAVELPQIVIGAAISVGVGGLFLALACA
ncbi:MAG: hypothetical protein ACP5O6_09970 [Candidatus Baltobacteraceae bacterium]